ncbi:hypothetical protein [Maribellus maritimus]|uniref:hypothetical protein n=1 Tax=Maribellus maritimus TaxID=2870838 RepID=UPI001EECC12D|nr:hypothetical protein [Maribellus maritimus]MCG6189694.1 hypothetical protein [Maribellus maritimus]
MNKNLEEQFKTLQEIEVEAKSAKEMIKIPILSSHFSSRATIVLAIVPALFTLGVIFAQYLKVDWKIVTVFYSSVINLDQKYGDASIFNWILWFLILGSPAVIVVINLLAILHVYYNRLQKEIIFTIKLKWMSITIVLLGLAFFLYFFGYLVVENL